METKGPYIWSKIDQEQHLLLYPETIRKDPKLITKLITCEESWICQSDPEPKSQSMHLKTPTLPRAIKY